MIEYIGIDIGGTNTRVGAIDKKGNIVCMNKFKTREYTQDSKEYFTKLKETIEGITEYSKVKGIGVGVPGAVDLKGNITTCRNVPVLKDYPLRKALEKEFKVPVSIENDAKIATLAEAVAGAGKKYNTVVYVTLSTGLGGGVSIDKKIYHGEKNLGGYFSRMILDGENMAEHLISGTAILERANKRRRVKFVNTEEVFMCSKEDKEAEKVVTEFKRNLLNLLLNISITLSPDLIILGGGVMKSKKYFLDEVVSTFREKAHRFAQDTEITVAKLDEPGVVGAAVYAKSKVEE